MTSGAYEIERPDHAAAHGHMSDPELLHALKKAVNERAGQLVMLRRRIHAAPEPAGEERETSLLVLNALRLSLIHI